MTWYGFDHQPIDATEAERLFTEADRRVACTEVGSATVSTVFLVLDHNWSDGPPILYETMVFDEGSSNGDCWRYATRAAALAGHDQVVAALREWEATHGE